MKLAISNIAWSKEYDELVYKIMQENGFSGLEIAPTRVLSVEPYSKIDEIAEWYNDKHKRFNFMIPSMQSIWYGMKENIFDSAGERKVLTEYTRKAINFAVAIGCKNLVFGCPRNRNMPQNAELSVAVDFFRDLGEYAADKGTVIGMEANPTIYNTNYINDTRSALNLIKEVESEGFRLNLDIGTVIQNNELLSEVEGYVGLINHVHISEPWLKPIKERKLHQELKDILSAGGYDGFVSIEMEKTERVSTVEEKIQYIRSIFG